MKIKTLLFAFLAPFMLACGMTVNATQPAPTAEPSALSANTEAAPTPAEVIASTRRATVTAETLRIRREPSTGAEEIGVLAMGDIVIIGIAVNTDNPDCHNWYPTQSPNGWVCADFLEVMK